jgi:photosystem II stability/assembly factor-like uncharacterized protein
MKNLITLAMFGLLFSASICVAQWTTQKSNTTARFRGVSAVSSNVAWASGSGGTFARTTDGGATWQASIVPEAESLDFRDVHAIDANTAYLLSIGEGDKSRIYKTTDGGKTWALQFINRNPKAFFDAIAFWDAKNGIAFSDPVDGRFLVIKTSDGGATWKPVSPEKIPPALTGEGAFAASGTCLITQGKSNAWFATGGAAKARVFRSTDRGETWSVADTPISAGKPAAGIFSIAFKDAKTGVIVGGDYEKEKEVSDNAAVTRDGGQTWQLVKDARPSGYRSCVVYVPGTRPLTLIAVGPSGSDYSTDDGASWKSIDSTGYHAVSFAPALDAGWAVGERGLIAKFTGKINSGQ